METAEGVGPLLVDVGPAVGVEGEPPEELDPLDGDELGANVGREVETMAGGAVSENRGRLMPGAMVRENSGSSEL